MVGEVARGEDRVHPQVEVEEDRALVRAILRLETVIISPASHQLVQFRRDSLADVPLHVLRELVECGHGLRTRLVDVVLHTAPLGRVADVEHVD